MTIILRLIVASCVGAGMAEIGIMPDDILYWCIVIPSVIIASAIIK